MAVHLVWDQALLRNARSIRVIQIRRIAQIELEYRVSYMFKKDSELIAMLDFLGFDYEMDSLNPGIRTKMGEFISYDILNIPSTHFEKLSY